MRDFNENTATAAAGREELNATNDATRFPLCGYSARTVARTWRTARKP
jgi:hypothetical protein